ncbi:hypothetical protein ACFQ9V_12260 [Leifsonia sp. NPDC056665]|uniref:hypothetical protein n=1 Tax=Leifsonia sp. NPDC056665 TaxID=3345901 RepID=UPI00367B4DC7
MTANPADDPVLRLLEEAGLEDDAALAALLGELTATAAAEPPTPSRDVVRLMSGVRPGASWFARRGARTTTVVLLAAVLAGGASAAAAASPAFHTVVDDAFSSLAKLVRPPTHPEPAAPDAPASGHDTANEATPSPQNAGHLGKTVGSGSGSGSGSAEAADAQGSQAPPPSPGAKDDRAQEPAASGAQLGTGSQPGAGGVDASGDGPAKSPTAGAGSSAGTGTGTGAGGGHGDDQGASGAPSTQKGAPSRFQPVPTPSPLPTAAGSRAHQGGSASSNRQGSDR